MLRRRLIVFLVISLMAGLYGLIASPSAGAAFEPPSFSTGILTGAGAGGGPHVKIFDVSGTTGASFFAYGRGFTGGVHVAAADADGDGTEFGEKTQWVTNTAFPGLRHCRDSFPETSTAVDEIITGAGPGGGPHVRLFDVFNNSEDHTDTTVRSTGVSFFAYGAGFTGGVRVAGGDVDKDGCDEIVTGAGPGGGPHVRVFDVNLRSTATPTFTGGVSPHSSFFAFSRTYTGGIWVGVSHANWEPDDGEDGECQSVGDDTPPQPSDNDGCNTGIILAGAGSNGASTLKGFSRTGGHLYTVHNYSQGQNPTGAVKVSGRENGHWATRIITGTGGNGSDPLVRILSSAGGPTNLLFAFEPAFGGGVNVGVVPAAAGGYIVAGAGPGGGPHVKAWNALTDSFEGVGPPVFSEFAYASGFRGGVFVDGGEFFADCNEGSEICPTNG